MIHEYANHTNKIISISDREIKNFYLVPISVVYDT